MVSHTSDQNIYFMSHSELLIHFIIFRTLKENRKIRRYETNTYDLSFKISEHKTVTRRDSQELNWNIGTSNPVPDLNQQTVKKLMC